MEVIKVKQNDTVPKNLPADSRTINQMKQRVRGYVSKTYKLSIEIKRYLQAQANVATGEVYDAVEDSLNNIVRELSKIDKYLG